MSSLIVGSSAVSSTRSGERNGPGSSGGRSGVFGSTGPGAAGAAGAAGAVGAAGTRGGGDGLFAGPAANVAGTNGRMVRKTAHTAADGRAAPPRERRVQVARLAGAPGCLMVTSAANSSGGSRSRRSGLL